MTQPIQFLHNYPNLSKWNGDDLCVHFVEQPETFVLCLVLDLVHKLLLTEPVLEAYKTILADPRVTVEGIRSYLHGELPLHPVNYPDPSLYGVTEAIPHENKFRININSQLLEACKAVDSTKPAWPELTMLLLVTILHEVAHWLRFRIGLGDTPPQLSTINFTRPPTATKSRQGEGGFLLEATLVGGVFILYLLQVL